ncbi:sensor histidine kinase [Paenibacillus baekrokdamisoli]|uniref:Sensor histidine kinase n=1 Tax=Paenibacillus baekrokdamisoli TaxID=1712516 RepID=A0A3G9J8Z6_9BACL|nr:histidine kinase [Paenibacillus baekrokdamisoli]MBB3067066.1 two-component system sensor histidine kinase YesM [Paenibacillus baekrokdamisoli]BBH19744.1 sensor histidine kinase [Paenibacillus baekrokdamisoli]
MDYLKRRPIKLQLLMIFILFVMVVSVVMLLTYFQSKKVIYQKNEEYSIELLDKITQYIESQIENIDGLVINTSYNMDVHQYLKSSDLIDKIDLFKKVDSQITTISQLKNGIVEITIIGKNGNNVNLMSDKNKRKAVFDTITEMKNSPDLRLKPYYAGLKEMAVNGVSHQYFVIGSRINNIFPSYTLGYFIVILDLNALFPKFTTMLENGFGNFYVLDRNGTVSSSNDIPMIGKKLDTSAIKDNQEYIIQTTELTDLQGRIVNIYSKQDLFRGLEKIKVFYWWIMVIFIPFMCLLLWVISRNVLEPIKTFMRFIQIQKVKNIYHGQKRIELIGYNEIMIMAERFNGMLDEIDQLTDEVITSKTGIMKLGLLKKQAELAFLKLQVNPHFLYNMLESLRGMASEAGAMEIRDMVAALGKMLRYSIKGQDVVKLSEELDIAKSYLMLQQFRFDDRFEVHIEFPEDLLSCRVIKMILQPILENAITHGLENRMVKGNLWLGGKTTLDGDIVIWIKDDGLGMTNQKLDSIQAELAAGEDFLERIHKHDNEHLGIVNVHNRIRTAYGNPYGLMITSEKDKGTEVELLLPQMGEEANA